MEACVRSQGGMILESSFKKLGCREAGRGESEWEGMREIRNGGRRVVISLLIFPY